jgi:hypothetical protein
MNTALVENALRAGSATEIGEQYSLPKILGLAQ